MAPAIRVIRQHVLDGAHVAAVQRVGQRAGECAQLRAGLGKAVRGRVNPLCGWRVSCLSASAVVAFSLSAAFQAGRGRVQRGDRGVQRGGDAVELRLELGLVIGLMPLMDDCACCVSFLISVSSVAVSLTLVSILAALLLKRRGQIVELRDSCVHVGLEMVDGGFHRCRQLVVLAEFVERVGDLLVALRLTGDVRRLVAQCGGGVARLRARLVRQVVHAAGHRPRADGGDLPSAVPSAVVLCHPTAHRSGHPRCLRPA